MDDGGAETLLGRIVGGRDVRAVEEDEQVGPVLTIARLEAAGIGRVRLLGEERAEDEAIDGVLDAASASGKRGWGERRAKLVQLDGPAEQVAQFDGPDQPSVAVRLDRVGQIADLERQAELVGIGVGPELGTPQVRDPACGGVSPRKAAITSAFRRGAMT